MMIIPSNNGYQWLYNHYITIDLSLGDIWWFIVNSSGYHFFPWNTGLSAITRGSPPAGVGFWFQGRRWSRWRSDFQGPGRSNGATPLKICWLNLVIGSYTSYTTKVIGLNHIQSYEKWISQYRKTVQKNDQPYCLGTPIRSPINQYFLTAGFQWSSDLARFQIFGIELRAATLW